MPQNHNPSIRESDPVSMNRSHYWTSTTKWILVVEMWSSVDVQVCYGDRSRCSISNSTFNVYSSHRNKEAERQGSAMPEQVTMIRNRPEDRGFSCIPLFDFEWLASSSPKNPQWQLGLSAIRILTRSWYDPQHLDAIQFRASHSSMHD